jgi:hypothetical protein
MCNTSLGGLNERTPEIHYLKQVNQLNIKDKLRNNVTNLILLHKEYHKTISIDNSKGCKQSVKSLVRREALAMFCVGLYL